MIHPAANSVFTVRFWGLIAPQPAPEAGYVGKTVNPDLFTRARLWRVVCVYTFRIYRYTELGGVKPANHAGSATSVASNLTVITELPPPPRGSSWAFRRWQVPPHPRLRPCVDFKNLGKMLPVKRLPNSPINLTCVR